MSTPQKFKFTIEVEVTREGGLFASREDIAAELTQAIEDANPGTIHVGDDGSVYNIDAFDVSEF